MELVLDIGRETNKIGPTIVLISPMTKMRRPWLSGILMLYKKYLIIPPGLA